MESFTGWIKSTVTGQRVMLAAKTALAVGIAWLVAPLMPGTAHNYLYYAPLGVLVSMSPTFIGSARAGLQTLIGLLLGVVLASAVLLLGTPSVVSISLAVGVGVLFAGMPRLGAGRDYVPVATLLVLITGAGHADDFSLGYATQMGLGVLVGLLVNLIVFPPLALDTARARISRTRSVLVDQLEEAAAALVEKWPPEHEDWASRRHTLEDAVIEVRHAVHEAAESQQANPRALRHARHRVLADSYEDLEALENITFYVRDVSEVLAHAIWDGHLDMRLHDGVREPIADCLTATAEVLRAWEEGCAGQEVVDAAAASLARLSSAVASTREVDVAVLAPGAAVALDVQRLLSALRYRLLSEDGD